MRKNLRITLNIVFLFLFFYSINVFSDNISAFGSLYFSLKAIGYEQNLTELQDMIEELFPSQILLEGPSDTYGKIQKIAFLVKQRISYDDRFFNLFDVLRERKANCLGYVQLVYVIGSVLGLEVSALEVYPNHIANLIKVGSKYLVLDLSQEKNFYISPVFDWENNYRKVGQVWVLKNGSEIDELYKIVQIIDEEGIIASRYNNIGYKKASQGLYEEALEYYNKAIQLNPYLAKAFNNRGVTEDNMKNYEDALWDYNRAIEINPVYWEAYNNKGNVEVELNRFNNAVVDFSKVIKTAPNLGEGFNNRGNVRAMMGWYPQAINDYNRAIELIPNFAEAFYNRGITRYVSGNISEAIEDIEIAIKLKPDLYQYLPEDLKKSIKVNTGVSKQE